MKMNIGEYIMLLWQCCVRLCGGGYDPSSVSYTHLRAHETKANLVCRLLLEKKKLT